MSLNKALLIGNLTSDAKVRTVGQNQVASFSVATNERFKKADGTVGESTEYHDIELWGSPGVHPYLLKGASVYVEGRMVTEAWTDQNGQPRKNKKIKATIVQLLGQRQQETHVGGTKFPPRQQYSQPTYSAPTPPQQPSVPAPPVPPVPPAPPAAPAYQPPYGAVAAPPQQPQPPTAQPAPGNYSDDLPF